jgi:hypothetical protein
MHERIVNVAGPRRHVRESEVLALPMDPVEWVCRDAAAVCREDPR